MLGPRRACVARELTKIHEEVARGTLPELAALFRSRSPVRGEATIVVEGSRDEPAALPAQDLDARIAAALDAGTPVRAIARELARASGRPAREVYRRAVDLAERRRLESESEDGAP